MGPKTSGTAGADFEKHIDQLFELPQDEPAKEKEEEKEGENKRDKKPGE